MKTCYGCKYLIQGGDGVNGCLRYGIDGPTDPNATVLIDDPPEPLYADCYTPSEKRS